MRRPPRAAGDVPGQAEAHVPRLQPLVALLRREAGAVAHAQRTAMGGCYRAPREPGLSTAP